MAAEETSALVSLASWSPLPPHTPFYTAFPAALHQCIPLTPRLPDPFCYREPTLLYLLSTNPAPPSSSSAPLPPFLLRPP